MGYDLYIDVLFLVNFAMDILILIIVRTLMKKNTSVLRIILSGGIGALWACVVAVYPILPIWLEGLFTYIVIGGLMIKIAWNTKGTSELLKGLLGLYLSAVTLGGTMHALYQYTNTGYYVEQFIRGDRMSGMPLMICILLAAGSFFGIRYLWINLLEVQRERQHLYEVTLMNGEQMVQVTGLLDTGNHLYEPVSHRPVHVVSKKVWDEFYKEGKPVYLIPYHTIGTSNGMMPGMFIDSMEIAGKAEQRSIIKPLIAVSQHPMTRDGSYDILLHEDN